MSIATPPGDVTILNRLIRPEENMLPLAAARAILKLNFGADDRRRMRELSAKAREGALTSAEQGEIDCKGIFAVMSLSLFCLIGQSI